ncbi:MAG TPA: Dyp-type peroxidase [Polyangiaceae bacterium]|nr:Dyp-type peroxidase [Polyangiaceae bacterium]
MPAPFSPRSTATRQFASLTLAPVVPNQLASLRSLLEQIGDETVQSMQGATLKQAPHIPFKELATIHYARFVLLDAHDGIGPLLAFATDYDGPEGEDQCPESRAFANHLDELLAVAGTGLERVFAHCEGYRSGKLVAFMRKHQCPARTFYVGSSGRSRAQIVWESELRREVDGLLDAGGLARHPPERVRAEVLARLAQTYPAIPNFPAQPDLTPRLTKLKWWLTIAVLAVPSAVLLIALLVGELWIFYAFLVGVLLTAAALVCRFRQLESSDPQFQPQYDQRTHEHFIRAAANENLFLQNQLTHLVPVKPGPLRWALIRVVFTALDVLARYQYNHGKLGDIPSIHFARWALIPGRGVLFFSNFDSSWQSYLGDFIDKASSGLTAVWSNTVGYPRTKWLLTAGSRDASRFLAWTRAHQQRTQVWYCAYPGLSIVNVNSNTEIRRGLADPKLDAANWLFHLRNVDQLATDQLFANERKQAPLAMSDIQGIILWGYGHMPEARYLMFRVARPGPELCAWLAQLQLTSAEGERNDQPPEPLLNIAFTSRGLLALGVEQALCERFATPFVQGSEHPYRTQVNGDVEVNAPENWAWGSERNPVDVLLLVYARTVASVEHHAALYRRQAEEAGLELVVALEGTTLQDRKEHFGFRDGIAQPMVKGSGRGAIEGNTVAAGEFLLGHRDGYDNVSHHPESTAGFAFGRNGSYLVFRQLEQNVPEFWKYCASRGDAVRTASKLVGRWPSGAPLVRHPEVDPNDPRFSDEDTFTYLANDSDNDRYGARCPFGAHIRRSNPRDWQLGADPDESLKLANLHRILRRGRPYGPPLDPSMSAPALLARSTSDGVDAAAVPRGLQFLCFNADIERQFEFIQQQWCNNPKFAGQNSDADPLLGARPTTAQLGIDPPVFTLQSDVRTELDTRVTEMQRFVRVVGSGYFFMPSIPAVRMLGGEVISNSSPPALEEVAPDEQLHIDNLIDTLRNKMQRDYAGGRTLRDAHPKMHGCVRARFTVEPPLDPALSVGLFREARTYKAWVRFSNQNGTPAPDARKDIRGVALKLLDVPGKKLLDGNEDCTTHDFILATANTFVCKDVAEFDGLIRALASGWRALLWFLVRHPPAALRLLGSLKRHTSPLDMPYFSAVPYLCGTDAVKYVLRPVAPAKRSIPASPRPDYLREALAAELAETTVQFDFLVQPRRNSGLPIEKPEVAWPESKAPLVKVATLEIPSQTFDTAAQREFGDNLSFNPWRCLPEHRPLGSISRARRQVYRVLSAFRHDRNAAPQVEPEPWRD